MRGTGTVALNGATIYAFFAVIGRVVRLRMSVDECDRLDLFDGRPVRVALPGEKPSDGLVTATRRMPPFVWVKVETAAGRVGCTESATAGACGSRRRGCGVPEELNGSA